MHGKICLTFTTLLFVTTKGSMNDPGPQTFIASTPQPIPAASPAPHYEMKEVIVYLTPSQIRALQSGQGVLEPVLQPQPKPLVEPPNPELGHITQPHDDYDEDFRKELERQKAYIATQPNVVEAIKNIQRQKNKDIKPVKEPSSQEQTQESPAQFSWYPQDGNDYFDPVADNQEKEKYSAPSTKRPDPKKYNVPSTEKPEIIKYNSPSSEKPDLLRPHSYNYFSFYTEKKGDNIDIKIFHPSPVDKLRDELDTEESDAPQENHPLIKKYQLVPYEYLNKKLPEFESSAEKPKLIQKNVEQQSSVLFTPAQPEEQSQSTKSQQDNSNKGQDFDEELLKLKYASRYNDQKQAIENQNLLKQQNAQAQIEAIAKSPPVEVHREVSITKHKPMHIINHVQVPVPQPYLVRVPEPFEVKVPQPYPVPLEIVRHVPVEVVKTEKIEVPKPVPYEVEKHVAVPVEKKVYVKVDKPYIVEKFVPVEVRKEIPVEIPIHKPQKLTILRHIWEHK